mmetsp:Transcript_24352/g.78723  ORF Transcript_24352/g.78723 Transcript_24352/m.78723 type:complete len:211 (-) Transcript_24352:125-757(-)
MLFVPRKPLKGHVDAVDDPWHAIVLQIWEPKGLQVRDDKQRVRVRRGRVLAVDRRNASSFGPRSHNHEQKLAHRVQGGVLLEEQRIVAFDRLPQAQIDLDVERADPRRKLQERHARVQDLAKSDQVQVTFLQEFVDLHDRRRVSAREVAMAVRNEVDVRVGARQAGLAAAEQVDGATGPPLRKKSVESIRERTSAIDQALGRLEKTETRS